MSLADSAAGLPPAAAEHLPDDVDTLKRMVLELPASLHEHRRDNEALRHCCGSPRSGAGTRRSAGLPVASGQL